MKRQYRVQFVLSITAAIGCLLIILAARQIALQHLGSGSADPHQLGATIDHVRYQFRALLILFTIFAAVSAWLVGGHLMVPFERLRSELIAGSISSLNVEAPPTWSADAHHLKHAALKHEAN